MWQKIVKIAVKMLVGIAALVWLLAPVSKWIGFCVFALATIVLVVSTALLQRLEKGDSAKAVEEFRKPNY